MKNVKKKKSIRQMAELYSEVLLTGHEEMAAGSEKVRKNCR